VYLLIEHPRPDRWQWALFDTDHRRLAGGPEPFGRREECLAAAADHLGGEIEIAVVERDSCATGRTGPGSIGRSHAVYHALRH
jgi:hypothetical protein